MLIRVFSYLRTPTGEYTTKTGYKVAIKIKEEENIIGGDHPELDWFKSVWKILTSPKVKLFLWKVFQNAIPVGELLAIRNINVDTCCKRCGTLESINHLFFHCPYARNVWRAVPVSPGVELSGSIDLRDVWTNLVERTCLPPTGLAAGHLAPWILWQLWISRNSLCFKDKEISVEETVTKALKMAKEWNDAQEKQIKPKQRVIARQPPPPDCDLVRSDAAWRATTQMAGLGWTISKQTAVTSRYRAAFTVNSALVAEGLAMRQAMKECKEQGSKRLICESDSAQLIKALNGGEVPLELYGIVADIHNYSVHFDVIFFQWISRDKNTVADLLAKQGLVEGEVLMAST